jgi:hypothetical protein
LIGTMVAALQATLVIVGTVALTVATIQARDPVPFSVVGIFAIAGLFLLEWKRPRRWLERRLPALAPPSRKFDVLLAEGRDLRNLVLQAGPEATEADRDRLMAEVNAWLPKVVAAIQQHAPQYEAYFWDDSTRASIIFNNVPAWASPLVTYVDQRTKRLGEILMKL